MMRRGEARPAGPRSVRRGAGGVGRRLGRSGFLARVAGLGAVGGLAVLTAREAAGVAHLVTQMGPATRFGLGLAAAAGILLWLAALLGAAAARGRDLGLPAVVPVLVMAAAALASAVLVLAGLVPLGGLAAVSAVAWLAALPGAGPTARADHAT